MAKLLIVEPDDVQRGVILEILEGAGHEVRPVASGREGIAALEGDAVDMIITNFMIGEMIGPGLLMAVRAMPQWQEMPFMFVSATKLESGELHMESFGDKVFFHWPLEGAVLHEAVSDALRQIGVD